MRAGLALLLLLSTMLGRNCQDTDSQQCEHAMPTLTYSGVGMCQVHDRKTHACVLNQSTHAVLAYIQESYHTDSSAGGCNVARQLESMEDKLDTILISLQTILPRLDKIDNVVQNLKDGQTVLKKKIKAVDATMAEHSAMVIATANETKVHLSREVLKLYKKLSEATSNLSSQSNALTIKVGSLSTQTQSLTSSFDTLSSNTGTLTTRVDLVASRMDGLTNAFRVKDENGTVVNTYCIITSELNPASSCQQLARDHPHAASDYYWVNNGTTQPVKVYCDMDQHCCNSTGGWVRVANIDITDTNQQCPPGFNLRTDIRSVRSCNRSDTGLGCTPITFSSHSIEYSQVCGRIRAYQYSWVYAFWPYFSNRSYTIEDGYVYGMSLTHGRHPRQHIWTFASAYSEYYSNNLACPCTRTDQPYTGAVPPFIGEDYFCDTGVTATRRYPSFNVVYADNPLWDGQGCGPTSTCCSFNHPPWFCKQLPQPTTDDLELRVCGQSNSNTPFDQIEIYIQ